MYEATAHIGHNYLTVKLLSLILVPSNQAAQ